MRYENWDVLLFPENSKVPIQEFKTQCFVTKDEESPYLRSPSIINPSVYGLPHGNFGQLPVLTTFIPSLPQSTAFRVSVHSWEKPRPSRTIESLMQPDDTLLYEVRVFIDGICVSGSIFSPRTTWPHVIDYSSHIDKNGNQDNLRFPAFHQEILEQMHWDAGELHGRIRTVISEGFSRPHRTPPFERVKDIIAFSFQHAPLHILEYSNIAWPNAAMWSPAPQTLFKYNSGSGYSDLKEPEDAHAHSPTRHGIRRAGTVASQPSSQALYNAWTYRNFPTPPTQWPSYQREPRWLVQEPYATDAFIDPYMIERPSRGGTRSSLEDVPMPDYAGSSSASSRAISSMTGVSYEHSKQPSVVAPTDEERYSQLIETMSPLKVHNSTIPAAPPTSLRPSAAAEARSASYTRSASRTSGPAVALKEISQPGTRDVSESSAKSNMPAEISIEPVAMRRVHASPSPNVKGKKEAMGVENKENETDVETPRKDAEKTSNSQPKVVVRTSGSIDVPRSSRRSRSSVSILGDLVQELANTSKEEISLISPVKAVSPLAVEDHVQQNDFEDFLDSRMRLGATAAIEIGEAD
ncbi:hypothetical protein MPDQ_004694 [Monascus purpureus]|uniref:Uncharacterized protein n=1 Tax=Monascus purpureus TaxID=5098 RepID=A0A507QKW4_MONPU|nr:hypothetical protein MPDQ_004694 [Monascus purpureus]BDD60493.1 hypothetical protein MAP00_005616 [Monascus purpureus]